jgi:hypothetical protein
MIGLGLGLGLAAGRLGGTTPAQEFLLDEDGNVILAEDDDALVEE